MTAHEPPLERLPGTRRDLLALVKRRGEVGVQEAADFLGVTHEAARKHLQAMVLEGWLTRRPLRGGEAAGRPSHGFTLTPAGDHLFPKAYDALAIALVEAVAESGGPQALRAALRTLSDSQVRQWRPLLAGLDTAGKLEALKGLYLTEDPFMEVETVDGRLRLIERNCPFLNVATRHPALCSLSIATLERLLGFRVVREKRFQAGDGRCVFRVETDRPVADHEFHLEDEPGR